MMNRRQALGRLGTGALVTVLPGLIPATLAAAPTEKRLVVVVLRGGLDGLAAVPPFADRDYRAQRGTLALAEPGGAGGALDLDGRFGLHPSLQPLQELYEARELVVFHAVATPHRGRSHFDGQDVLETGAAKAHRLRDGWLNRALALMGPADRRLGLAVGSGVPLILGGRVPVGSWAPQALPEASDDFLARLAMLYRNDPVLGKALAEGIRAHRMKAALLGDGQAMAGRRRRGRPRLILAGDAVGKLLAQAKGPRIAVLEAGGWDTHAGQGAAQGRLAKRLADLGRGLVALKASLGPAWRETAVLVVTEFGRTVAPNGTGGTDHGTAGVAFLLGGAVEGGRVVTRWPGLAAANLYEGRDLAPVSDVRGLFKAALVDHLGLAAEDVERRVFPESRGARRVREVIRV